jgi:hypothetical protein
VRVTRRYHVIDRISRRLGSLGSGGHSGPQAASGHSGPQVASGHSGPQAASGHSGPQTAGGHSGPQAAGGHQSASVNGNDINAPSSAYSNGFSANGNGVNVNVNVNGAQHQPAPLPRRESRVPPLHGDPTVFLRAELNGHHHQPQPAPATRLGRYSRYLNGGEGRGGNLEKQLLLQQAEICSLREGLKQQCGLKSLELTRQLDRKKRETYIYTQNCRKTFIFTSQELIFCYTKYENAKAKN